MSLPKDTNREPHADPMLASVLGAADRVDVAGCPDAEIIGLYVDQALAGAELRAVEAHVHDCGRCQATVAAFVRADAGALAGAGAAADVDEMGGARAGLGLAAWFTSWRWLVPATSLAAVGLLAVWVGRGPADQVAESARGPASALDADTSVAVGRSSPSGSPPAHAPSTGDGGAIEPRLQRPPAPLPGAKAEVSGAERGDVLSRPATVPPIETRAKSAVVDARENTEAPPESRRQAADAAAGGAISDQATATFRAPPAAREAAPVEEALSVAQAAPPASPAISAPAPAAVGAAVRAEAPTRSAEVLGARDVVVTRVPPAASFRLRAGAIEHSRDKGATWQRAATPAGVTILALASPAPNVCWAVATGAVLRTTDGATFSREPLPTGEPLTAIAATNAMSAVVTTASGARFVTSNGGRTWTAAP